MTIERFPPDIPLSILSYVGDEMKVIARSTLFLVLAALPATLLWARPETTAAIRVRFVEGTVRGFMVLRAGSTIIASGDIRQIAKGAKIENRTIFHFKDGSLSEETVVFTQHGSFSLETYRQVQRGPSFAADTEVWLDRSSGKYH